MTGEYVFHDVENVYIVQEREFIARRLPIYKIGLTKQKPHERFKGYSKSTDVKACMSVNDCRTVETMLIEAFKTKFVQRLDIGRESFEGELLDMEELFTSIVHKYNRSPEGMAPPDSKPSPRQPTPLTLEHIRKTLPLYDGKLIKRGNDGFKEFLLLLINTPNGPNMKCTNKEKLLFSRLDEKGKWVKDGKKFINNVFTEVGDDGKTILKRVDDFWLDVKESLIRSTNKEDQVRYQTLIDDLESLKKIYQNEKVIRSRFVKEALVKIAK
jgi:hypothetical protein